MTNLYSNIRFFILSFTILICIIIFFIWGSIIPEGGTPFEIKLTETYALFSLGYLYLTLLPSPLYSVFPSFPFKPLYFKSRRSLGVSVFIFAIIHAFLSFFYLLGGFNGLLFLSDRYLIAIIISSFALIILSILTITSFNKAIKILGKKWIYIHKTIYIASILIITHALILGTHFIDPSSIIYQIFLTLFIILIVLEFLRIDKYIFKKYPKLSIVAIYLLTIIIVLIIFLMLYGYTIYSVNLPVLQHSHD